MFNPNNKPKIRTRTVVVKKDPTGTDKPSTPDAPRNSAQTHGSHASNGSAHGTLRKASAPSAPGSRYSLTPANKTRTASAQSRPERTTSLSVSHARPRKRSNLTPSTPQWASDSSSSEEEDTSRLGVRKRQKTSSSIEPMVQNRSLEPDFHRQIRFHQLDPSPEKTEKAEKNGTATEKKPQQEDRLIHGLEMTRGEWIKDFKPAFPGTDKPPIVKLQYPSPSPPEKFELVIPRDNSNFNPVDDIYFNLEEIIQHYLPPDLSFSLSSDVDGPVRLLKRAVTKGSPTDFSTALTSFNALIRARLADSSIPKTLDSLHAIPLSLTKRILAQVYQRTVSPHAHLLRKVTGKETTYGELLPPFVHQIFSQTGLNSRSVFIDLGSGVGNVVLQSALQTGAESWGIELLPNPAKFASLQASELRARAKLWNISLGPIHLLHGDMLESPAITAVLSRADVILVNNKVFGEKFNSRLLDKFLDLKIGCKVVSLQSFGAGGKKGVRQEQSIAQQLFDEESGESGTNSVSWAGESVEYFIMTRAR
ncbi:histone-lysine N-methyltransferas-like protein [Clohesyomyces aquaticus]|uniref:Histone-lysine N-methyltransferase, H3 lysine-79 specific n=1 Tax=Clohesyomyces aquaticus TaxID=1231657 RepID=A0A1Y2A3L1_9PLEO|nr:histone-lysine N-methyltransferas-like protein [Clohesyomyces aquaticus]